MFWSYGKLKISQLYTNLQGVSIQQMKLSGYIGSRLLFVCKYFINIFHNCKHICSSNNIININIHVTCGKLDLQNESKSNVLSISPRSKPQSRALLPLWHFMEREKRSLPKNCNICICTNTIEWIYLHVSDSKRIEWKRNFFSSRRTSLWYLKNKYWMIYVYMIEFECNRRIRVQDSSVYVNLLNLQHVGEFWKKKKKTSSCYPEIVTFQIGLRSEGP